jgi:hypothetical protein
LEGACALPGGVQEHESPGGDNPPGLSICTPPRTRTEKRAMREQGYERSTDERFHSKPCSRLSVPLGLLCFVALASLLAGDPDGIACGWGDLTYRRREEGRALLIETGVVPAQKSRPYYR